MRMDFEDTETWGIEILFGRFHGNGKQKRGDRNWMNVWVRT